MRQIFVYDEFSPENVAMMQALYSRDSASVTSHVEKVRYTGSGQFHGALLCWLRSCLDCRLRLYHHLYRGGLDVGGQGD